MPSNAFKCLQMPSNAFKCLQYLSFSFQFNLMELRPQRTLLHTADQRSPILVDRAPDTQPGNCWLYLTVLILIVPIATTFFHPKLTKHNTICLNQVFVMQLFVTFPTIPVQTLCHCAIWGAAICHAWCPREDWSTKEAPASIVHDQTFLASLLQLAQWPTLWHKT